MWHRTCLQECVLFHLFRPTEKQPLPRPVSEHLSCELDPAETPGVQVSKFVVIPKSGQPGKWRLILDLSSPQEYHLQDSIDGHQSVFTHVCVGRQCSTDNLENGSVGQGGHRTCLQECASTSRWQTTAVHEMARRVANGYGTTVRTSVCTKDIFYWRG